MKTTANMNMQMQAGQGQAPRAMGHGEIMAPPGKGLSSIISECLATSQELRSRITQCANLLSGPVPDSVPDPADTSDGLQGIASLLRTILCDALRELQRLESAF